MRTDWFCMRTDCFKEDRLVFKWTQTGLICANTGFRSKQTGSVGPSGGAVGWGARFTHAHSVGSTIENGQLCRAEQKTGWTRPLGTTAAAPEDRPGDCGTGRLLTGVNSSSFPGDNLLLITAAEAADPQLLSSAARRLGFFCSFRLRGSDCKYKASRGAARPRRLHHGSSGAACARLLREDAVFAAAAVDFMFRERRGAAVQRGGKTRAEQRPAGLRITAVCRWFPSSEASSSSSSSSQRSSPVPLFPPGPVCVCSAST